MSNFDQEVVDDGQVFDGLRPCRQLVGLTVGRPTFGMLNVQQKVSQAMRQRRTDVDECSGEKNSDLIFILYRRPITFLKTFQ